MITIINGPNLNLLGKREPQIYGTDTLRDIERGLSEAFPDAALSFFQSNCEGLIVDRIHNAGFDPRTKGIVINPGAFAHYSIAIRDAIAAIPVPVIEVHISNIHAREEFRRKSVTGEVARGVITGLGKEGYRLAVEAILHMSAE